MNKALSAQMWFVLEPTDGNGLAKTAFKVRHYGYDEARARESAKALSKASPGVTFYVMQARASVFTKVEAFTSTTEL